MFKINPRVAIFNLLELVFGAKFVRISTGGTWEQSKRKICLLRYNDWGDAYINLSGSRIYTDSYYYRYRLNTSLPECRIVKTNGLLCIESYWDFSDWGIYHSHKQLTQYKTDIGYKGYSI